MLRLTARYPAIACASQTVLASGRERTRPEFDKLFAGAGFKLNRVVQTRGPLCVVEAVPI